MVSVSGYLIGSRDANKAPLPPEAEYEWWYQFYFATERGRLGYEKNRREFSKLIWKNASPKWRFDDATFDRSAQSFDNPDHVAIVIHNYRWRLGVADGETRFDELETRLAQGPVIAVPTITMEGDANGAPHPDSAAYAKKFSGKYEYRLITGGIGHNLPQEAPAAFDNPDHVGVVVHNYRWRLGLAEGEPKFDALEQRLAQFPAIGVPTITLEGDANGAPHPEPSAYAKRFSGKYAHRTVTGGIGHNLPQEAPRAFAQAVVDIDAA
jgi:pimeloyl-ACP methyl ester carboxylesterase